MFTNPIFLLFSLYRLATTEPEESRAIETKYKGLEEHTLVTENGVFPYVVAVLKKSTYLSTGSLIDENWVLAAAGALFLIRESSRFIRVRLGSINCKEGGLLLPIKYFEIHPYFDASRPLFDLALIRLAESVRYTPTVKAIKLQKTAKAAGATHFVVASWTLPAIFSEEESRLTSMEIIRRRRTLSVSHIHPTDQEDCSEELQGLGVNDTAGVLCLDTGFMVNLCTRDVGAPVVLNNRLWGVVSSWRPARCEDEPAGPSFATLVSHKHTGPWVHAIVHGHTWGS